ncbi:ubiquitin carboxy-terminal hydrolase (macronuclear) [Tetrahymena thermophila SB210]|uniref:ubiquitinyl hydrolase 1 n=1 Tax=Tetrahymena thermophila (strain SB210) TaxID=312017 RepID=I7M8M5_TETTS|nr:ubiquitin carboxy-terminal hydrolase [Tetrahymena thermophila SB210]EAR98459.2 ubiquitin carboxy-terminal hydrolase [Tetrahymena thermophila SB210]|eukprot:XP_001018704.2 ubiquitin carboxy-terminal hydrolase [Tetrahymena thermophila SB210]
MQEESKPKNCAHNLEKPVQERQSKEFVGLKNKGATCYLNSLIQAYYATPEFRKSIFDMQLCVENITKKSNFVENTNRHNFLLAFQKLFVEMQELNVSHMSTEDVTKSFGWDSNEALQQQDIQEAIRVIFDGLEKALKGTEFQNKLLENFKIETVDKIKCLNCGNSSERINIQYDLMTQIKGQTCLEESLINFQNYEKLNGDNKYNCENCGSKQDALKGTIIRKLPNILTISLLRFEFDMVKLQRSKLNDRFTFGLELDASLFCDQFDDLQSDQGEQSIYELYAVLIHKGGAHGGHYHTYIRDFSQNSDWVDPKIKKESNQDEINQNSDASKQMEIEIQDNHEKSSNGKNGNGNHQNGNSSSSYNNKSLKRNTRRANKGNDQQDDEPFPIPVENQSLLENWFDIDDEIIKCISGNKIQKQFGSNSDKESAYILLYRKKSLPRLNLKIPAYFEEHINSINNVFQQERTHYENEKNSIELAIRSYENLNLKTFKFNENAEPTKMIKISKNQKVSDLYELLNLSSEYSLFEIAYCENQMVQIYQEVIYDEEKKVGDMDLEHRSELIYISKLQNEIDYNKMQKYCGKENTPYLIKVIKNGENQGDIIFHSSRSLRDLKQTLVHLYDVPYHKQYLKVANGGATQQIPNHVSSEEQTISDLGIIQDSTIILSELEDTEMIQEGKLQEDQRYIILEYGKGQPKKYVININDTLMKIKNQFVESLTNDPKLTWRFRHVDENKIYKHEDYDKSFKEIMPESTQQDEIRLQLEEGPTPNKEEVIITFKFYDDNFQQDVSREVIANQSSTIKEVKEKACSLLELDPQEYFVYKVDENEQPSTCVKREGQLLNSSNLKKCTLFYLISITQNVGVSEQEYVLYYYPDDNYANSAFIGQIILNKNLTVDEIKETIAQNEKLRDLTLHLVDKLEKDNIRLREMRKNHQMGTILKKSDKKFGKIVGSSIEVLCVQIKAQKEVLEEDDLVLQITKRKVETQSYEQNEEFIFKAGKAPTINDLKREIIKHLKLEITEDEIDIAKHYINQFEWREINLKTIQKYKESQLKAITKKKGKKKKGTASKSQTSNQQNQVPQESELIGKLNNQKQIKYFIQQIKRYFRRFEEKSLPFKRWRYLIKFKQTNIYFLIQIKIQMKLDIDLKVKTWMGRMIFKLSKIKKIKKFTKQKRKTKISGNPSILMMTRDLCQTQTLKMTMMKIMICKRKKMILMSDQKNFWVCIYLLAVFFNLIIKKFFSRELKIYFYLYLNQLKMYVLYIFISNYLIFYNKIIILKLVFYIHLNKQLSNISLALFIIDTFLVLFLKSMYLQQILIKKLQTKLYIQKNFQIKQRQNEYIIRFYLHQSSEKPKIIQFINIQFKIQNFLLDSVFIQNSQLNLFQQQIFIKKIIAKKFTHYILSNYKLKFFINQMNLKKFFVFYRLLRFISKMIIYRHQLIVYKIFCKISISISLCQKKYCKCLCLLILFAQSIQFILAQKNNINSCHFQSMISRLLHFKNQMNLQKHYLIFDLNIQNQKQQQIFIFTYINLFN